jgi:hypothetical protein
VERPAYFGGQTAAVREAFGKVPQSEVSRSLAWAEAAVERIRAFRINAQPPNYEVWFTYCSGARPKLFANLKAPIQKTLPKHN